jgi:hypothetical protein
MQRWEWRGLDRMESHAVLTCHFLSVCSGAHLLISICLLVFAEHWRARLCVCMPVEVYMCMCASEYPMHVCTCEYAQV